MKQTSHVLKRNFGIFIITILLSVALAFISSTFLISNPAKAVGEKLTMNAAGNTISGSGGIFDKKDLGLFRINSTFTKVSIDQWRSSDPYVDGYIGKTCVIDLTIPASGTLKVTEQEWTCWDDVHSGLTERPIMDDQQYVMDQEYDLTGLSVAVVEEKDGSQSADINYAQETAKAIGDALDGIKAEYYKKLGNKAPCSSQGCNDAEWNKMVYTCWVNARSNAARSAALSAQGGEKADVDKLTRNNAAACIAQKTDLSLKSVTEAVNTLDVAKVNAASQTAKEKIEAERNQECLDQDMVMGPDGDCVDASELTSCAIDYVGWILCPVVNAMASMADGAYNFIAKSFLEMPATMLTSGGPVFGAWQVFQNIANVILVILFLVIIFSQLTSVGISNYGIKKLLPKIIIAAVLMNLSFIICTLAVDLSNILGYGLKDLFSGLIPDTYLEGSEYYNFGSTGGGGGWAVVAGVALGGVGVAAAGGISLAIIALIPVLLSALLALIMIFFILVGRQVLLILLIVISPVAIAMYLLPNTAQLFTKWRKTFVALLMVFPIVGLVYGVSFMASNVMHDVYSEDPNLNMIGEIITAGIMVIPFFVVPSLLKKSLDSVGNIGAMAGKFNTKMSGGLNNKLQNAGATKSLQQASAIRKAQIGAGSYSGRGGKFNPRNWQSAVNRKLNSSEAYNAATAGYGNTRTTQGARIATAQDKEALDGASEYLSNFTYTDSAGATQNLSSDQKFELARGKDVIGADGKVMVKANSEMSRAAMAQIAPIMTAKQAMTLAEDTSSMKDASMRKAAAQAIAQAAPKAAFLGGKSLAAIEAGTYNQDAAITDWATNRMSSESLAGMDADAIDALGGVARTDSSVMNSLNTAVEGIESNEQIVGKMTGGQKDAIIRNTPRFTGPTPPPPPSP